MCGAALGHGRSVGAVDAVGAEGRKEVVGDLDAVKVIARCADTHTDHGVELQAADRDVAEECRGAAQYDGVTRGRLDDRLGHTRARVRADSRIGAQKRERLGDADVFGS